MNPSTLGATLDAEFTRYRQERESSHEGIWLDDLRQYRGEYDAKTVSNIPTGRSKAFIRLTRTKVRALDARMADLLFPAGDDKNWEVNETPIAEVSPKMQMMLMQDLQKIAMATGQNVPVPDSEEAKTLLQEWSKQAADKMERHIDDQLNDVDYAESCRRALHSGHLYGVGVLVGPLAEQSTRQQWVMGENGFELEQTEYFRPLVDFCPVWNYYPDLSVLRHEDCYSEWRRHIMNPSQLLDLLRRPGFDSKAVLSYIKEHSAGNYTPAHYESQLKSMGEREGVEDSRGARFEVLERWGLLTGQQLMEAGIEGIGEEEFGQTFETCAWLLGGQVIKLSLNPTEQQQRPFHLYVFEQDDTGFLGVSIPSIIRDGQRVYNAAVRAAIDNAAMTAGPMLEVDAGLLDPSEDPRLVYPFRIWVRSAEASAINRRAVQSIEVPNSINQLMSLAGTFKDLIDESSAIPSYLHGENVSGGAAKTFGGLSALMGAANIVIKDAARNFDEGITVPFIRAMYHWNMQFTDDDAIKGDYQVSARGSSSLVVKELQAQQLEQFAMSTANPIDAPYVNRHELNVMRAKVQDMPNLVYTKEEVRQQIKAQQSQADPSSPVGQVE